MLSTSFSDYFGNKLASLFFLGFTLLQWIYANSLRVKLECKPAYFPPLPIPTSTRSSTFAAIFCRAPGLPFRSCNQFWYLLHVCKQHAHAAVPWFLVEGSNFWLSRREMRLSHTQAPTQPHTLNLPDPHFPTRLGRFISALSLLSSHFKWVTQSSAHTRKGINLYLLKERIAKTSGRCLKLPHTI